MPKAFISYSSKDNRKKEILESVLKEHAIEPIIILNRENPKDYGESKIKRGIKEADFLIPILTSSSISTQWINQEIGYAESESDRGRIKIVPIVEEEILSELKQFINLIQDLPYRFHRSLDKRTENKAFKKQCVRVAKYIKEQPVFNKNQFDIEASFSYLNFGGAKIDGRFILNSSMIIENKSVYNIAIKDIEIIIPYKHYKSNIRLVDEMIFEIENYYTKEISYLLKTNPLRIKAGESESLYKISFITKDNMYINNGLNINDYIPMFKEEVKRLNQVKGIITFHNNKKIELIFNIYSNDLEQ